MAEEQTVEVEESGDEGGGGSKLVLILTGVNLLISLGVAGALFVSFKKEATKSSVNDIAATEQGHGEDAPKEGDAKEGEHGGEAPKEGEHGAAKKKPSKEFGRMVTFEQFTVNLSGSGSVTPKFARVNISVSVASEDTEAEINSRMPQVRNTIIDLFNSKRPNDLVTPDGRTYLKEEIKNALNTFLTTGKVIGVYFTNFAVTS